MDDDAKGVLRGIRIIELAGIGPGPFCGMMLADHGAEVIRIHRPGAKRDPLDVLARSRRDITVDLKCPEGVDVVRDLCRTADGLIEGFRPGVMERLGLGPDVLLNDNPKLVFGRMTGWGQTGPMAPLAGHDINYIALTGVLDSIGPAGEKPTPPVNYIGDFGGGGMLLAFGMTAALLAVSRGGDGQVVDAAMTDGSAILSAMMWHMIARGMWSAERGKNLLDGGSHFYDTYVCRDGRCIAVGAIEPHFHRGLLDRLGLSGDPSFSRRMDPAAWPALKAKLAAAFAGRTRDEWCAILEGADVCFAPVLTFEEAPRHPHNAARGTFTTVSGQTQPAPAPRFGLTPAGRPSPPDPADANTESVLHELGVASHRIEALKTIASRRADTQFMAE